MVKTNNLFGYDGDDMLSVYEMVESIYKNQKPADFSSVILDTKTSTTSNIFEFNVESDKHYIIAIGAGHSGLNISLTPLNPTISGGDIVKQTSNFNNATRNDPGSAGYSRSIVCAAVIVVKSTSSLLTINLGSLSGTYASQVTCIGMP